MEELSDLKKMEDACKGYLSGLHEQILADDKLRNDDYVMAEEDGRFKSYTSNGPAILTGSYERTLSSAPMQLSIKPLSTEEGKRKNNSRSMTEQLAKGALWEANRRILVVPSGIDLQSSWANGACEEGGTITRVILHTENIGGEDKLIPDILAFDAYNSKWIEGSDKLLFYSHTRYGNKHEVGDFYGIDKLVEDERGRVAVTDYWTPKGNMVVCGDEILLTVDNGKECKWLNYIPVFIRPVGSQSLRQWSDSKALCRTWFSAIAPARKLYTIRNTLMSLILTQAHVEGKPSHVTYSDDGKLDAEVVGDVNSPNAVLSLKVGEKIEPLNLTTPLPILYQTLAYVDKEIALGGIAPIALGFGDPAQTASGTAILTESARQSLYPFQIAMQQAHAWTAEEIVKQYKHGKFEETEFQGYEATGKRFRIQVTPNEINDNEHFTSELKLQMLRDKMAELAMFKELLAMGATSQKQIREAFNDDPEQVRIERAEESLAVTLDSDAWDLLEKVTTDEHGKPDLQKAKENAWTVFRLQERLGGLLGKVSSLLSKSGAPNPALTEPSEMRPGMPELPVPGAEMGQVKAMPMTEADRLARLGMVKGR